MNQDNLYSLDMDSLYLSPEDWEEFNTTMTDDKLDTMLIRDLETNVDYWNKAPFNLHDTDKDNVNFLLGQQHDRSNFMMPNDDEKYTDNRLFSSTRAILSYAFGQLAKPDLTPSSSDQSQKDMARNMQQALYQHTLDEQGEDKVRAAGFNLITRKRGFLKLRFDLDLGTDGDIVTEVASPEDIIIDRQARFGQEPNRIYHRVWMTVDELCARFPGSKDQIFRAAKIKQGRFSQMSEVMPIFEAWFSYRDQKYKIREGVTWFYPNEHLILDKGPNPNWIYTGNDQQDKITNLTNRPPKPFAWFNYLNLGRSFIDETCLFEQAMPAQKLLNERLKQLHENISYANGRWIASSKAFSKEDAKKIVNKGPKTIAMTTAEDVNKAMAVISSQSQAADIFNTIVDARNEVDTMMGTPAIFRGADPKNGDTLGRDQLLKSQSGMLQDDLVRGIQAGMSRYYLTKLQMMRVYFSEDHTFSTRGGDGNYTFVRLNAETIDTNVKVGVEADSTLALDKEKISNLAADLLKANKIDYETAMNDLGLPDARLRTERYMRMTLNPYGYMMSIEADSDNNDAEQDILMLISGKTPKERDNYDVGYFNYYNHFMTTNRFQKLIQENPPAAQAVTAFLMATQHTAMASANLQGALDDAGQLENAPILPPVPKVSVRLDGKLDPGQTDQYTGSPPPAPNISPGQPPPK